MNKMILIVGMIAFLLSCSGSADREQTSAGPDTFLSSRQAGGKQDGETAATELNTGEYRSQDNPDLLEVKLPQHLDNQMIRYKAITIYYNTEYRVPNCVAYELTATQVSMADAPDAEKRDNYQFNRDSKVPGCADWWEYKETGYDRGHMAPAMDMRWDKQAMSECFLMTNICPQNHELNDGEWRHTEEAIHNWARKAKRLIVFTGPVFGHSKKTIGKKADIVVPARFFKVVYAPEQNRAIAFLFDNAKARRSWTNYAVTIDQVERETGIDFLSALPDDVETAVESTQNIKDWPRYTPRR